MARSTRPYRSSGDTLPASVWHPAEAWLVEHRRWLYREAQYARRRGQVRQDEIDDVLQETSIRIWRHWHTFTSPLESTSGEQDARRAWAATILRHCIVDAGRARLATKRPADIALSRFPRSHPAHDPASPAHTPLASDALLATLAAQHATRSPLADLGPELFTAYTCLGCGAVLPTWVAFQAHQEARRQSESGACRQSTNDRQRIKRLRTRLRAQVSGAA